MKTPLGVRDCRGVCDRLSKDSGASFVKLSANFQSSGIPACFHVSHRAVLRDHTVAKYIRQDLKWAWIGSSTDEAPLLESVCVAGVGLPGVGLLDG